MSFHLALFTASFLLQQEAILSSSSIFLCLETTRPQCFSVDLLPSSPPGLITPSLRPCRDVSTAELGGAGFGGTGVQLYGKGSCNGSFRPPKLFPRFLFLVSSDSPGLWSAAFMLWIELCPFKIRVLNP